MAVAIIHDAWTRVACLYDNTTDTAFGPVFKGTYAGEDAEDFLVWLEEKGPHVDPRQYSPAELRAHYNTFNEEREREPSGNGWVYRSGDAAPHPKTD